MKKNLEKIAQSFNIAGTVQSVEPLGKGLINDTFIVRTAENDAPDYVMQRVNHAVFKDVDTLMTNIGAVTSHIRRKLEAAGTPDTDRRVLEFVANKADGRLYHYDGDSYWRIMKYIDRTKTVDTISPESARTTGKAFGEFQAMLVDIDAELKESIPDFHTMEYRLRQLRDAVEADAAGRAGSVRELLAELESRADSMCRAERMHREGVLPKRICHCDTKVNNILFDENGEILCVIDLDTVMPSFVFSDYGDFLRTAASSRPEDDPEIDKVEFDMDIYRAFTQGYISAAKGFLTPVEIENLPYAAALFPYMQAVRFLTDYINGDTYYKTAYADHNLVRTRNQFALLQSIERHQPEMAAFIAANI